MGTRERERPRTRSTGSHRCGPKSPPGASTIPSSTCTRSRWFPRRPGRPPESYQQAYAHQQPADAYGERRQNRAPETQQPPNRNAVRIGVKATTALSRVPGPRRPAPPPAAERPQEGQSWPQPDRQPQPGGWDAPTASPTTGPERFEPQPPRRSHRRAEAPPRSEQQFAPPPPQPAPQPARAVTQTAADSLATACGCAQPAGAAGLAAGQFRGPVVAARGARQQLELRPGRQRRVGVVGVRQRAVTRQASHRGPSIGEPTAPPSSPVERRGRHSSAPADSPHQRTRRRLG